MSREVQLDEIERRYAAALDLLMRISEMSAGELGRRVGLSRQSVQYKRDGGTRIRVGEASKFAAALGVPVELFSLDAGEILRWLADHGSELEAVLVGGGPDQVGRIPVWESSLLAA